MSWQQMCTECRHTLAGEGGHGTPDLQGGCIN